MVPPVSESTHSANGAVLIPVGILVAPLLMDQDLSNLMDGDQSTFYQPPDEPNNRTIGSDVILNFEFPQIPDNATIEQIIIGAGVHLSDSDGLFERGYGVTPYSRNDLTEFLDLDIGPGIEGVFIISPATPIFPVIPNIATVQTPVGTVFEISIDLADLTLENARNLSVAVQGINDAGTVFDRVSEIYATVI